MSEDNKINKALADLIFIGSVEDEVVLFKKTWKMKTLTAEEHLASTSSTADYDPISRIFAIKVEVLSRAIKSVDGEPFGNRLEAAQTLRNMQSIIIDRLYQEYDKLQVRQENALSEFDELKK